MFERILIIAVVAVGIITGASYLGHAVNRKMCEAAGAIAQAPVICIDR